MRLHHALGEGRLGPCPQAPQTLGKSACARGVIRLPHPLLDLSKRVAQRFGGPRTDVEERMEKTQEHRDLGEQRLPRALRGLPASGLDGLRRIIGVHDLRFAGKNARRFLHVCLGGRRGNRGPQATGVRRSGSARNPLTLQPALLFVGPQVLGAWLGGLDGRADSPEATQTVFQAIPGQRLAAQNMSHGPTGHRQSPPEPRMGDVVGTPRHVRHHTGGGGDRDRTALLPDAGGATGVAG